MFQNKRNLQKKELLGKYKLDQEIIKSQVNNEHFYDWVMMYNPYEKLFYAVKREHINNYYNNREQIPEDCLFKSDRITFIIDYLTNNVKN